MDLCINPRSTSHNRITKDQNKVPRTKRCSRIRASAPRRSNEYYNALTKANYDPKLGSKESHEARYYSRLLVLHSEIKHQPSQLVQEAAKDLYLHGQSLTKRRVASTIETFNNNSCNYPHDWLICLC